MAERNIVVSGQRLKQLADKVESAGETGVPAAYPADLGALIGAPTEAFTKGLEAAESTAPAQAMPDDGLASAAMLLRFNAAVQMLEKEDVNPGVFNTVENQVAALIQSQLAEQAERHGKLAPAVDGREAKFDEHDVRWAFSLISWIGKLRPHAWQPPPPQPEKTADSFKLALTGDWGTGLYGAPEFKNRIQEQNDLSYYIHLGDVYYAGTVKESENNFLKFWPKKASVVSRACNGNHEMYSGGYGYFDTILPQLGQTSSCFALQNAHWLIVGLDSAYADHDLANDQNVWLQRLVDAAGSRRVVLLSHHQPYSHFEHGGEKLVEKLLPLLNSGRISAWYWGHEHRCVVYDPHPQWKLLGRCIGHSGYPYFRKPSLDFKEASFPTKVDDAFWRVLPARSAPEVPGALLLDGPNPFLGDHRDEYGPNGWVTLEFRGKTLFEQYYLATGKLLWEQMAVP